MKTKYEWIRFEANEETKRWECFNGDDDILGAIWYATGWRQFSFIPDMNYDLQFNFRCLEDIADFLKQLNKTKGCYKEDRGGAEK